jgi:hypothetical protein
MPNENTNTAPAGDNTNANTGGPSFEEILHFDPFEGGNTPEPPQEPPADGGDQAPSDSSGDANTESQQQAAPTTPQPATPSAPPTPVSQADLESLMRQQTNTIAAALRQPPQQQPSAPQNKFNLAVPDPLIAALRSEDPNEFKAGVGALINSLANHVWENFRQSVQSDLLPMIPRMIEQYTNSAREQEQVGRDFYGTYPQLQNPMFAPMIQTVGATIAEEYARAGRSIAWGPELRDEIAKRIFSVLPQLKDANQQQQQRQPRRSFSTGNGARPPAPTERPQEEMLQMLFGGPQH